MAAGRLAVDADGHHGLALRRRAAARPRAPASGSAEPLVAGHDRAAVDDGADAVAGDRPRSRSPAAASRPRSAAARHDAPRRAGARCRARRRPPGAAAGVVDGRRPRVARAGPSSTTSVTRGLPSVMVPVLSSTTVSSLCARLERLAVADQDAVLGALAGADHDRRRRRQPQRAGAGDDQHGDEVEQRVVERRRRAEDEPDDERDAWRCRCTAGTKYGGDARRPGAAMGGLRALRLLAPAGRSAPAPSRRRPWWRGT